MEENCWIMERILQFADSKTTGERWIFFSENVRKCVNNAAFSNIHNLFSERVNTTFFAVLGSGNHMLQGNGIGLILPLRLEKLQLK